MICPPIFADSAKNHSDVISQDMLAEQHEVFQVLMSQAKEQTQTIGFCIQQLCQTIAAGKLKLTEDQFQTVLMELSQINGFVEFINEKFLVQNNQEALCNAIMLNHELIRYLTKVIQNDISKISVIELHAQMTKRMQKNITFEDIFTMAEENQANIDNLVFYADHIGLTWYNRTYRFLKRNNATSIITGAGIVAATAIIGGIALAAMYNQPTGIKLIDKFVGDFPVMIKDHKDHFVREYEPNGALKRDDQGHPIWKELTPADYTPIQRILVGLGNLQQVGLVATSALLTINYKDVFSWMYKDTGDWAKDKWKKKSKDWDQKLQGVSKPGFNNNSEKLSLDDMIGCDDLKQIAKNIANFMKHPERYERAQIEEHRGILLSGPPQSGKTFFAKIMRSLVQQELGDDQELHFIDAKKYYDVGYDISYIFSIAAYYAPCIIYFDELDMFGVRRDKDSINTSQLLTCMQGIDMQSKQIIVIGSTNKPDQIDPALLVDGRFGKKIHIDYPRYQDRKTYLVRELDKRCIHLDPNFVDCMAQETEGCTFNMLKRIITEAIILSSIEIRPVTQHDFEKTLDTEVRRIQATRVMSESERRIIATYQAGKAVAYHVLQTVKEVVKITINPVIKEIKLSEAGIIIDTPGQKQSDNDKLAANKTEQRLKLGEVFTKSTMNYHDLLSNTELEKECLTLCAGNAALQLFFNESFSECNKHDRAEAMHIIYNMVAQGEKIDDQIKHQAMQIKQSYDQKILTILSEHKALIEKIVDVLMKEPTIDRYTWKVLIQSTQDTNQVMG